MAASTLGPAVPFHVDTLSWEDEPLDFNLFLEMTEDLTGVGLGQQPMLDVRYLSFDSPSDQQAPSSSTFRGSASGTGTVTAFDEVSSPGGNSVRTSHSYSQQSTIRPQPLAENAASSVSPGEKFILTPGSSHIEYNASISEDQQEDDDLNDLSSSISPTSTSNLVDDFVLLSPSVSHSDYRGVFRMNNRPPPSTDGSGASHSRASSVAPPVSSSATTSFGGGQWGSVTSTTNRWMDHQNIHPSSFATSIGYLYDNSNYTTADPQFSNEELLSNIGAVDHTSFPPFNAAHRHANHDDHMFAHHPFGDPYTHIQQQHYGNQINPSQPRQAQYGAPQHSDMPHVAGSHLFPRVSIPPTQAQDVSNTLRTAPAELEQIRVAPSQGQLMPSMMRRSVPNQSTPRTGSYPQEPPRVPTGPSAEQQMRSNPYGSGSLPSSQSSTAPAPSVGSQPGPFHAIAKAEPRNTTSIYGPSRPPQATGRKGGRQKHSHLPEQARQKSHKMRKLAACWRCALQRDPCDEGSPCGRCMMKAQKGQTYFFECDRSKLPDFVQDFLPPQASMTLMHQKQTIEDCVHNEVLEWDYDNPIEVWLTCGYGPALPWKLYEFRPKSQELLGQYQYLQDPATGLSQRWKKYSPPFGLLKLDSSDDRHFDEYLDQLLSEDYLWDFGWTCFEEETQVDPDAFQANLLDLMCKLYQDTHDIDLKDLLHAIIRMMMITYIMGHTLTILEGTLPKVLNHVKLTAKPQQVMPHTSPRLANRQLKFFFSILRNNIYEKILKWQQQTLHTSGKKESTWLPSFCAMLGFAMVLEEVQRTIQIQADAKVAKEEMNATEATNEAKYACERIDARYGLLTGLFKCKYRDKKWGENGSFGPGTPEFRDSSHREFLGRLRELLEEKQEHLRTRENVEFAPENQCRYTSRLVARFLLPFLQLPS